MMIALPIAMLSIYVSFIAVQGTWSYLTSSASSSVAYLRLYGLSQSAEYLAENGHLNYNETLAVLNELGGSERIYAYLEPYGPGTCQAGSICRVVEISNLSYVMVMSNENTSKP